MSSLPAVVQRVGPLRGGVRTLVGVDASGGMTSGGGGSNGYERRCHCLLPPCS